MAFGEAKVYFDGSHYIAIPHTTRVTKKRPKTVEETIVVSDDGSAPESTANPDSDNVDNTQETEQFDDLQEDEAEAEESAPAPEKSPKTGRKMTRKELFEELYRKYANCNKYQRKALILKGMLPYFKDPVIAEGYVMGHLDRKLRNLIARRVRMCRKAYLADFNYFCTFTYDSKLHTESSFRRKLIRTLSGFANKKQWKYMGVWERSPQKKRLHFHGIFHIPHGTLPGTVLPFRDYNFNTHSMQTTWQSLYFNERFGRSDFERFDDPQRMGHALSYLMKYIEKSGEKIVYSKGLPQYFISDIIEDDVVCTIGQEDKKLLLFDDFNCFDEGVYMGQVSPEVISQMRTAN